MSPEERAEGVRGDELEVACDAAIAACDGTYGRQSAR
jgi:hypothetical protein